MVKLTKIYTRTGDDGTTGLVDGSRVSKADARMAAIGDVDEANSAIGVAIAAIAAGPVAAELTRVQNDLFDLGADLATPGDVPGALRIVPAQVERLERAIDVLNADLPPLGSFILPGGLAAPLHLARAIVRRAERAGIVMGVDGPAAAYLNRLSDYLFVAARAVNAGSDPLWQPGATR